MTRSFEKIDGFIRDHPFLATMRPEHLQVITEGAKVAGFERGETLLQEGGFANRFFLIQWGKIELQAHDRDGKEIYIETLGGGDVFGWSWFIPPFSWSLQARAIEPTKVIVVDGAHLLVVAENDPVFGYALMKRIAQLMSHRFHSVRHQLAIEH